MQKQFRKFYVLVLTMCLFPIYANGAVLFQDNFDNNCTGTACNSSGAASSVPTGWGQWYASDGTSATYDGVTHYSGEISSPGRLGSGKSLKLWRHSGSFGDYTGSLLYNFTTSTNNLFFRYYLKMPVAFNGTDGEFKGWRMNLDGGGEIYLHYKNCGNDCRSNGVWTIYDTGSSVDEVLNNNELRAIWDGNWHSIEWELGLGTRTLKLWIDGVLKYSDTNRAWHSSSNFDFMQHFPIGNTYSHNGTWQSTWQAIEADDLVFSTTYIGPDGSSGGGGTTTTTPTISNVSGTVSTGQTLTIAGANMVNENKTNWSAFNKAHTNADGFEGSSPSADGYSQVGPSGGTYDTSVKILGSKSIKFHVNGPQTENVEDYNAYVIGGSAGDMWYRYYVRYRAANNIWFNNYAKQLYIMGSGGNYYLDVDGGTGMPSAMKTTTSSIGQNTYGDMPGGTMQNDRWYLMEVHIKDSATQSQRLMEVWMDNVKIITVPTSKLDQTVEQVYVLLGIPNAKSSPSGLSVDNWWDGLVSATSRVYAASVIEVSGDGSTWKYQEPVKLSDASIQFKLDLSGVIGTNYRLRVTNNKLETSAIYTLSGGGGGGDTQAPSVPAGLAASVISSSQINLSWSASTDNVGVTGYKIYRGGTLLTTTTSRTYNNTGLTASTAYSYRVSAIDVAGNESSQCTAVSATTQAAQVTDTTKPSVPAGLSASVISSSQINLSWSASTDNVGVTGYKVYRGGTLLTTTTSRTYNNTGLTASTAYSYRVSAIDAAENESSQCTAVSATTQAAQTTDTTKPSVPAGLSASVISSSQINLAWSASTDNVGVTGYKIYRGGTLLTTTTSRTHNDTGLSASTAYSYRVSAIDAAGNESSQCTAVSATTQAGSSAGAILFQESFSDNSFASRNWYDNTAHGTVVSGGQSGNCLQWAWSQGGTTPTNGGSMRMKFTATDSLYISFYIKFQSGWRGSQKAYHPHMILIPSNLDSEYTPLANNYLNTYIEFVSDVGSPYSIRPLIAIQDEKRVNTSNGTPPNNLTAITENRSVAYCNTPVSSGASGTCYADNPYYSANTWKASSASVSTNVWHHVEVYFKMNTISGGKGLSNGIMQKWVDGALVINKSDVLYRTNQDATKKWAQFVLAPYIGDGSPIAQSMWIDELTVGTASPNNVAPKAPTGFSVKGP